MHLPIRPLAAVAAFALSAAAVFAQGLTLPNASPRATVAQTVGITQMTVDYSRPSANGRTVWGQLVPYGFNNLGFGTATAAPWRVGADMNTVVTFSHDVSVAGQSLPAGAYGLFLAPTAEGRVTVIFSRDSHKWGSFFYEPANDALRTEVQWEDAPATEMLTIEFTDVKKGAAVLAVRWADKRIPIPLAVDTDRHVFASLARELTGDRQFEYQNWVAASNYLAANGGDLDLALAWADRAISGQFVGVRNFATLSNKAAILERAGRGAEAAPLYDELMNTGTVQEVHQLGRRLIAAGQPQRALAVFRRNAERFPDVWPVNYGLARGYSAIGDYAAALEAILKAAQQVPAGDTLNANAIRTNIERLRRGENIN